jgi:hypothetical protein
MFVIHLYILTCGERIQLTNTYIYILLIYILLYKYYLGNKGLNIKIYNIAYTFHLYILKRVFLLFSVCKLRDTPPPQDLMMAAALGPMECLAAVMV